MYARQEWEGGITLYYAFIWGCLLAFAYTWEIGVGANQP